MRDLRIETLRLTIPSGQNSATGEIEPTLSQDGNILVGAVARGDTSKLISIGVYDGNNPLIEPIDVSHYQKDGDDIVARSIPIQFLGGKRLSITVSTNGKVVSADTDIELIFIGNAGVSNYEWLRIESKVLNIPNGGNQASGDIVPTLSENGNLFIGAVARGDVSKLISISVKDSGSEVLPAIDVSHYQNPGASDIVQSALESNHRGGRELKITASTNGRAVSADTDIEVIFIGNAGSRKNY